ncbi:MAG TPA: polysaccharide pyruvyl transferase family protein, partial [Lachnospiraceae bacterium]
MKKNFLVHAYLCKNLGDDLFVRILCNRYPKARFHVVLDEAQREHFKDVENLIVHTVNDFAVKFHNKWMALRKKEGNYWNHLLKTCDGSIHIGGSVFTQ